MKKSKSLIGRVTEYFGTAYKAAKALGVTHQQYYYWQKLGMFPFKRGKDIERVTNGYVTAEEVWVDTGRKS